MFRLTDDVLAKVSTVRYDERMTSFPRFDFSQLPTLDLPKFELPKFELPNVDVLGDIELPTVEQLTDFARDAAYVSVGLAVTTVERLQELQAQLVELVTTSASTIIGRVERARDAV